MLQVELRNRPGVYAIINTATGARYIGASVYVGSRVKRHLATLRSGKHSAGMQADWYAYGEGAFQVVALEYVASHKMLNEAEARHIQNARQEGAVLYNHERGAMYNRRVFGLLSED